MSSLRQGFLGIFSLPCQWVYKGLFINDLGGRQIVRLNAADFFGSLRKS